MPFWSLAELKAKVISEEKLRQLTDDEKLGFVNEARVTEAGDFAVGLIEGSLLAAGYTLPLDPVPTLLVSICYRLIIYKLHQRKMGLDLPESIEKDFQNQLKLLQRIASKEIMFGAASGTKLKLHDLYEEEE